MKKMMFIVSLIIVVLSFASCSSAPADTQETAKQEQSSETAKLKIGVVLRANTVGYRCYRETYVMFEDGTQVSFYKGDVEGNTFEDVFLQKGDTVTYQLAERFYDNKIIEVKWHE
jgi:uncharacterized lipoprotein YehR (DUF1307 family)